MITHRGDLHKEILKSFDSIDLFINNTMPKNDGSAGNLSESKQELIKELLKKKIELDEMRSTEKLNFWRDVALLKKELREHMKEFRDMQSKTSMLDNLLDI
jgi:transcription antitermination factor NusA-like protein